MVRKFDFLFQKIMNHDKIAILERALERQKQARKNAERILEDKSLELYSISQKLHDVNQKLENLLQEKNSQLKGVFENINDAYLVMDLEGNVLKINDVAKDFFYIDLSKKDVNVTELVYEEDYEYAMNSFSELIETGVFTNYIARVITKKKEIKWVNINASIIYDNLKQPIAAQGIIRDITTEREEKLILDLINEIATSILGKEDINSIAKEVSLKISTYLETDNCSFYLVNTKNENFYSILEMGSLERELLRTFDIADENIIYTDVITTKKSKIITDSLNDNQYNSKILVPVIQNDNTIALITAKHTNTNYFKNKHLETLESIANLVSLQLQSAINSKERKEVELRNSELLNKLAESNKELEQYAHIVSHDLKSPLRSIAALTSWIKTDNEKCFDELSLQNFNDIEITLEKMDKLISDVLRFSSIEAISDSDEELVDLNIVVNDLIKILFIPKNITITIVNKLPIIKGDYTKYQQLFQNLIANAIKFNDKEKGIIKIDVDEHKSFFKFSVSDNGIGIEKRHFDKIFKIFQSLKKSNDSTGIGLSVVKKIVDLYQGEIWVESELNLGTTFHFTIKKR